jgi:prepilin-type N-terminal cleavage/methylation domain-containing protein
MRFGSIGLPAAFRSSRAEARGRRSRGFTLIEALVALALVLAFATALAPYLFQARRIAVGAEGRVAAHVLLRTLLDAPFDRGSLASAAREGELDGLRWRIVTEPLRGTGGGEGSGWSAYRVRASVAWGRDQVITAETVRLGRLQ